MRITAIVIGIGLLGMGASAQTQRRTTGPATLAIIVTDQDGSPVGDVKVTLSGPTQRDARSEQGRLVFENIPSGSYKLTFERDGFESLEREVTARGGAPIDVKVALTKLPEPPPPPKPRPALTTVNPIVEAEPVLIDVPSFIEKNFVGRAAAKTSLLACAAGGEATVLQLREPLALHAHEAADEYFYVIAGEGTAHLGRSAPQPLRAGVFLLVPRGVSHSIAATGRSPLVVISIKAGEKCAPTTGH